MRMVLKALKVSKALKAPRVRTELMARMEATTRQTWMAPATLHGLLAKWVCRLSAAQTSVARKALLVQMVRPEPMARKALKARKGHKARRESRVKMARHLKALRSHFLQIHGYRLAAAILRLFQCLS